MDHASRETVDSRVLSHDLGQGQRFYRVVGIVPLDAHSRSLLPLVERTTSLQLIAKGIRGTSKCFPMLWIFGDLPYCKDLKWASPFFVLLEAQSIVDRIVCHSDRVRP